MYIYLLVHLVNLLTMSVNTDLLIYNIIRIFDNNFNVEVCSSSKKFIKKLSSEINEIEQEDRIYYVNYALKLVTSLIEYMKDIRKFSLNNDEEHEIEHDFSLVWGSDNNVSHISLNHNSIILRNIIPTKLMKICGYTRNSNLSKAFYEEYNNIESNISRELKKKRITRYSALKKEEKITLIYEPICKLVAETLSMKRKCADLLYEHLFGESNRIVMKLYKNRFNMYDFEQSIDTPGSYKMTAKDDTITIKFKNGVIIVLTLQTNATNVKNKLSLKFHTSMENMNELFCIKNDVIKTS